MDDFMAEMLNLKQYRADASLNFIDDGIEFVKESLYKHLLENSHFQSLGLDQQGEAVMEIAEELTRLGDANWKSIEVDYVEEDVEWITVAVPTLQDEI